MNFVNIAVISPDNYSQEKFFFQNSGGILFVHWFHRSVELAKFREI